jgi:hypothetical protein
VPRASLWPLELLLPPDRVDRELAPDRSEKSGVPPGTVIRATARDRILHAGFHWEATIDGAAAESSPGGPVW